ncbi:MAG: hypothetical protein Q9202_000350 [Teloschistes flavicans]
MATITSYRNRDRQKDMAFLPKFTFSTMKNVHVSVQSWIQYLLRHFSSKAIPTLQTGPSALPADEPIEEETMEGYDAKHLLPIRLGQSINDKYKIISKLGYGGHSTIWLAHDTSRWRWQANRYVALKVDSNNYASAKDAEYEINLSKHITTANPRHEGYPYVRILLDSFAVIGPHGKHMCLVFEAMREPLWHFLRHMKTGTLPLPLLKGLIEFWLQGLDYLHTECNIIHTDIKWDNIMFTFGNPAVLREYLSEQDDDPRLRKDVDGRTIYLSRNEFGLLRAPFPRPKIADFGAAIWGNTGIQYRHMCQPNGMRAPEVELGAEWSYSVDIWSLGVMLKECLERKMLFQPVEGELSAGRRLAQTIALLGPPPKELLERGIRSKDFFNEDGSFKHPELIPEDLSLESSFPSLQGDEKGEFLAFLRSMIDWLPERRKTARELLNDPWLRAGLQ